MRPTKIKTSNSLHPSGTVIRVFAHRVRQWRVAAGLPLKHVARDLGVSTSIVCEWEHGHRFPSIVHLEAISRYVGLPVCCLLFHGHGHCPHAQVALDGPGGPAVKPARSRRKGQSGRHSC